MPLPEFHHQEPNGEDGNLCAWFALNHYKGGDYSKETFMTEAIAYYMQELGMNEEECRKLIEGGNDPSLVLSLSQGSWEKSAGQAAKHSKIIIPKKGHFIAVLKDDQGYWWNYNSFLPDREKLGGSDAMLAFLGTNKPIVENGYIVD